MSRRSSPQQKHDDLAFPVRVKITVPADGLGRSIADAHDWLMAELGPGEFAFHAQPGIGCSTTAFYFRSVPAAQRFVEAFPALLLADGTLSPAYQSPAKQAVGQMRTGRTGLT